MTSPAAERLYGWLLAAYPPAFRARFERDMRATFATEHADACAGLARVRFWTDTVSHALVFGLAERRRERRRPAAIAQGAPMRSFFTFDARDAFRSLRAAPIVTLVAVVSLALGVGATTALFSILNSLVFKPLPVRDADRLVVIADGPWTNPIWEQVRARPHLFDGAFAWSATSFDVSPRGRTEFVNGAYASGGMFDVLGIRPLRGRLFTAADDDRSGGPDGPVAVVSETFWRERLGSAPDVIGRRLTLNHVAFTIVGVSPTGFFGPDVGRRCDVFVPLGTVVLLTGSTARLDNRATWWLEIMGRLTPGETASQATAALRGIQPQIRAATLPSDWPADELARYLHEAFTLSPAATGESALRAKYRQPLIALLAIVGAVLLIACANLANLLLARAAARRRDLSVRLALGASAGRLARQLLLESALLAAAGAALGLLFAEWGSRVLVYEISRKAYLDLAIDTRVLAFTTAVAAVTALLFGLAPMLAAARIAPTDALKAQGRAAGDRHRRFRSALVVAQIALSLCLVTAAGLFIRSFSALTQTRLGFDPTPLLVVSVTEPPATTASSHLEQPVDAVHIERLRAATASVPGVAGSAASFFTPVSGIGWNTVVDNIPVTLSQRQRLSWVNFVSPEWFSVYGIRAVEGRTFAAQDRAGAPPVVVVNEAFAHKYFPGRHAVGQRFRTPLYSLRDGETYEIVGVVSDAVYRSIQAGFEPAMYLPMAQARRALPDLDLTVRVAAGSPAALERSVAAAVARVDADASVTFEPYTVRIRDLTTQSRIVAALSGFFGALALLLAGLGLYGVTSYAVNAHRTEIGVRIALGAEAAGVVRMVLRRVGWLVCAGVIAGALLSLWASHFIGALLFGVEPRDPATLAGAAALLTVIGLVSAWLPARRASHIDPVRVLREI